MKRNTFITLSFLIVLFIIGILASDNKLIFNNVVSNSVQQAPNEVELDNWELSTVFYDSTVDNGQTPLTEINWDASDGGYGYGEERTITIQINYKNSNSVKDYNPGDLEIKINKMLPGCPNSYTIMFNSLDSGLSWTILFGANDSSHSGYDWNLNSDSGYCPNTDYRFTNNKKIDARTNFEGTIQIIYKLQPLLESGRSTGGSTRYLPIEEYGEDECTHSINSELIATLNDTVQSNSISFNYTRTYTHPWTRLEYNFKKFAYKVDSIDNLDSDASNYIWVKYDFAAWVQNLSGTNSAIWGEVSINMNQYPYIYAFEGEVHDKFPDGTKVYNSNGTLLEPVDDEGTYVLTKNNTTTSSYYITSNDTYRSRVIYVGYPKSQYMDNPVIQNTAQLYARYGDRDDLELLGQDTIELDLSEYNNPYIGEIYGFKKRINANSPVMRYQDIVSDDGIENYSTFYYNPKVRYTGETMDVIVGDDLVYITGDNNQYVKLEENEYYFKSFSLAYLYNANGDKIDKQKYNYELWIRRTNETDYEKIEPTDSTYWRFTKEDKVVGWYIVIKGLKESLWDKTEFSSDIAITKKNIATSGNVLNYAYQRVLKNDVEQEIASSDSYNEFINKEDVMAYDMEKYGKYYYRSSASIQWKYYNVYNYEAKIESTSTSYYNIVQNEEKERFETNRNFGIKVSTDSKYEPLYHDDYFTDEAKIYLIKGFHIYEELPLGTQINSTEEEIKNSLTFNNNNFYPLTFFDQDGNIKDENYINNLIRNNTTIRIEKNWENKGKSVIIVDIDFSSSPLYIKKAGTFTSYMNIYFGYSLFIPYDSVLIYGTEFDDEVESFFYRPTSNRGNNSRLSNYDLDEDGLQNDYVTYINSKINVVAVTSTNQDVQTSVQTDQSNYDTGKVTSSLDTNYSYKLRVRTGTNDVTNLVIYESLEKYAKNPQLEIVEASGGRKAWHGELLGVDTSYAESKGYNVKVYYSTKEQPGTLAEDDSWLEYTDLVDKSIIKSFAFEYLDSNGDTAILPANSLTYVLINMKSPSEDLKYFTYNGCWTEWNAIDSVTGQPVDFITGINSNIVKVALPNSVEPEDKEITITKNWSDNSDNLHIRPTSVNYKIIATNDDNISINETISGDSTSNTWTDTVVVPKYNDDGVELTYTVEESNIELDNNYVYVSTVDGLTMTNKLNKKLTLEKIWKDNNNSYLTRPTNIEYNLLRNNNNYKTVTITGNYSNNTWSKDVLVDVYDNSNNTYTYKVEEPNITDYVSTCEEFTCTNTLSKDTNIKVYKVWVDNNNEYDTRPDSIIVHLYRNNTLYKDIEIDNTWESNNISIPVYDNDGVKYSYRIEENNIDGYNEVSYNQDTYTITNTLKENITLTIKKTWIDDNNSDNTRPDNLSITLLQNDNEYQTLTLEGDSNEWVTTIEVPKYNSNQEKYKYTIKELNDDIKDIYSDITYSEEELSVTNKLNKNTKLTITKEWKDSDNLYKTRPKSTKVYLYQNDELYKELELTGDENTWITTLEDVPMYDNNGKRYIYTIKEDINDKYGKAIYDQSNLSIVNELTEIPKVTLYFTVKNGYTLLNSNEMQYDEEGYRNILRSYNLDSEEEYTYSFKLRNVKTNKEYEGKLTTLGILEFKDIEYGTYRAIEEDDKYFSFVSMLSIEDIEGIEFTPDEKGGLITIKPTGKNIIYGANIINKIVEPIKNPPTLTSIKLIKLFIIIMLSTIITYLLYKKTDKYILNKDL